MSKNVARQRRAKAKHRDQFSRTPLGADYSLFLPPMTPVSTPFFDAMVEAANQWPKGEGVPAAYQDARD